MDHLTARTILASAWQHAMNRLPTSAELDWTGAVANLETGYGRAGQFGALASQGLFNWGALEHVPLEGGICPPGTHGGQDAGNARCFYVESSDAAAAFAFVRNLVGNAFPDRAEGVLHAMNEGDPNDLQVALDIALAMKGAHPPRDSYFEAPVETYGKGLVNSYRALRAAVGKAPPGSLPSVVPVTPSVKRVGAGAIALGVAAAFVGATLLIKR